MPPLEPLDELGRLFARVANCESGIDGAQFLHFQHSANVEQAHGGSRSIDRIRHQFVSGPPKSLPIVPSVHPRDFTVFLVTNPCPSTSFRAAFARRANRSWERRPPLAASAASDGG